jgi:ribose/xylose/arabinose/galactoside ABC-type transport system permease subunit
MEFHAVAMALVGGAALTGGRASIAGTLVGALTMTVVAASFTMRGVPYASALVVEGAIVLVAVILQRPRLV